MIKLKIQSRDLKRKVKDLREEGSVPGTMYGPELMSMPVKTSIKELRRVWSKKGEVYQVSSPQGTIYVKFGEIQIDPVTYNYLHFSLIQLPKDKENKIEIPVVLEGTPLGVKRGGKLLVFKDTLEVHGLIQNIPEQIHVKVANLDVGEKLTVADLKLPKSIYTNEPESEVVAICREPIVRMEAIDSQAVAGM